MNNEHQEFSIEDKPVAVNQLALFFNNMTLIYGYESLEEGMTRVEAVDALQAAGFAPLLAQAMLRTLTNNAGVDFVLGRLQK